MVPDAVYLLHVSNDVLDRRGTAMWRDSNPGIKERARNDDGFGGSGRQIGNFQQGTCGRPRRRRDSAGRGSAVNVLYGTQTDSASETITPGTKTYRAWPVASNASTDSA